MGLGLRVGVKGFGFRVKGFGFKVYGSSGFRAYDLGLEVEGLRVDRFEGLDKAFGVNSAEFYCNSY